MKGRLVQDIGRAEPVAEGLGDFSSKDIAAELRELRIRKGLSGERLGLRVGMSQSKISKIENRHLGPSMEEIDRILQALEVDVVTRKRVIDLAARRRPRTIRADRSLTTRSSLEADAVTARYFHPTIIPTILQTLQYRRSLPLAPPVREGSERNGWLKRQILLHDPAKSFSIVMTEESLRRVGLDDYHSLLQIEEILCHARLPNIRLGVIPNASTTALCLINGFQVYDERKVALETLTREILLDDPTDVEYYVKAFSVLSSMAVFDGAVYALLAEVAAEYRSRCGR